MTAYEWKKLLLHRRGLLLILAVLLADILGMLLFTQPYDRVLEENRQVYESYLAPVTGPLTQEKRDSLEAEMERLNQVHRDMEGLKQDYYAGAVSEEEYRAGFDALYRDDRLYTGFSKLYSQYIFVREQENRSFLYTGGWEMLLTDQEPDYLLLLLLIIVLSPIFCEEYASRMHEILLTQKRGARYQVTAKVCVALTLTAVLTAVLQCADLIYCAARFGLPHGDFSLQSLPSFGNAAKELTLWQAFWLQFALKELGYCYAAVWILFLSVWLKKYALTLMAGISTLALPFLTVDSCDVFLRVPAPWALTLGSIYLNGSKTYTDSQTGEKLTKVAELSIKEIGGFVCLVILIMACMLLFVRRGNTNHQLRRGKRTAACVVVCAAALILSGCGQPAEPVIYNSSASAWCESGRFLLMKTQEGTILIDQETEASYPFPASAFAEETVLTDSNFFCAGGYAYYVREDRLHPTAGFDTITTSYVLARVDLDTLTETVRYQWNTEQTWFFGLLDRESLEASPGKVDTFFLHGEYLYYVDTQENDLCRMRLSTGQRETYLDGFQSRDFAYDGRNLYYTDSYNRLVIHDLNNRTEQAIDEVVTEKFLLTGDGICFLNRRDRNTLYDWDSQNREAVKLDDTAAFALYCDGESLWLEGENGSLYRINRDGTGKTEVPLDGILYCVPSGRYLYYLDPAGKVCALDKESIG